MFLAIIDFEVSPQERPQALATLRGVLSATRAMHGNISYRVFCEDERETHVGIVQEWEDQAAFERYTSSEVFTKLGESLRPMMTAAPISKRFVTQRLEQRQA